MTGNLPVLTPKFHHPIAAGMGQLGGPNDYAYWSGNLPILSPELRRVDDDNEDQPGWVALPDPITKRLVRCVTGAAAPHTIFRLCSHE